MERPTNSPPRAGRPLWNTSRANPPASSIFISHETRENFEIKYGPVWEHVVGILTGLSTEEVEEIDEIVFEDPETSDILFAPRKTNVKTS